MSKYPYVTFSLPLVVSVISLSFSRFESVFLHPPNGSISSIPHIPRNRDGNSEPGRSYPPKIPILNLNFDSTESKSCPQNPVERPSRQATNMSSRIQTWVLCIEVLVRVQGGCDEERETNLAGECVVNIKARNAADARPSGHRQDEEEEKLCTRSGKGKERRQGVYRA